MEHEACKKCPVTRGGGVRIGQKCSERAADVLKGMSKPVWRDCSEWSLQSWSQRQGRAEHSTGKLLSEKQVSWLSWMGVNRLQWGLVSLCNMLFLAHAFSSSGDSCCRMWKLFTVLLAACASWGCCTSSKCSFER